MLNGGTGSDALSDDFGSDVLQGNGPDALLTDLSRADGSKDALDGGSGDASCGQREVNQTTSEGDFVMPTIETVVGNSGNDVLFGNSAANTPIGNGGNDALVGLGGKDTLEGGLGDDQLASNDLFGVPVQDGAIDHLDGGPVRHDYCRVPFMSMGGGYHRVLRDGRPGPAPPGPMSVVVLYVGQVSRGRGAEQ